MDIFKNAERGVEKFSFLQKDNNISKMSNNAAAVSALQEMAVNEKFEAEQKRYDAIERESSLRSMQEGMALRSIRESQETMKLGNILAEGKDRLFKEIVFELFQKSLVLDDDFIEENKSTLRGVTDRYITENGGYKLLEESAQKTDSEFLKRMKSHIDKIAMEVTMRKTKEAKEEKDIDILNFSLTPEEENKLDYAKDDLTTDEISQLVKDKVLTVVRDEKEYQEKETNIIKAIEDDLTEDEGITDEKSMNEALERIVIGKPLVEEATLFNTLFRASYKEYLAENVAIQTAVNNEVQDDKEDSREYNIDLDPDEDTGDPLDNGELNDELILSESSKINMDMIFTEAITKYTLMEMLYTIKLESYTTDAIQKLVQKILN